jgi:predicted RNA-binding Zn ribbon-like protein
MNAVEYKKVGFGQPALWIDFLNSLEHDGLGNTNDHLHNAAWRKTFLHYWKLAVPPGAPVPYPQLEKLRSTMREIADSLPGRKSLRPRDLQTLNDALNVPVKPRLLQGQNGFVWEEIPEKNDWGWILARIARSCAESLVHSPLDRLKTCPDPKCRWLFYDQTKAKSRIWCNERTCGNRNRVRRARAVAAGDAMLAGSN